MSASSHTTDRLKSGDHIRTGTANNASQGDVHSDQTRAEGPEKAQDEDRTGNGARVIHAGTGSSCCQTPNSLTSAGRIVLADESEHARGRLSDVFFGRGRLSEDARGRLTEVFSRALWSLKNVVCNSILMTSSAAAATSNPAASSVQQKMKKSNSSRKCIEHHSCRPGRRSRFGYDKLCLGRCDGKRDGDVAGVVPGVGVASVGVARAKNEESTQTNFEENEDEEEEEEDSPWEEDYSCVVCERSFFTARQLERHQLKKRHWGCVECDRRFRSLMLLEHHKDELNHWTEDEFPYDSDDSELDSLRECMEDLEEARQEEFAGEETEMLL